MSTSINFWFQIIYREFTSCDDNSTGYAAIVTQVEALCFIGLIVNETVVYRLGLQRSTSTLHLPFNE